VIEINGKKYLTIEDVAAKLQIHPATVRQYIERGIVAEPPTVPQGMRER
jgi:DNA-binding transcriptional MerR regulator